MQQAPRKYQDRSNEEASHLRQGFPNGLIEAVAHGRCFRNTMVQGLHDQIPVGPSTPNGDGQYTEPTAYARLLLMVWRTVGCHSTGLRWAFQSTMRCSSSVSKPGCITTCASIFAKTQSLTCGLLPCWAETFSKTVRNKASNSNSQFGYVQPCSPKNSKTYVVRNKILFFTLANIYNLRNV